MSSFAALNNMPPISLVAAKNSKKLYVQINSKLLFLRFIYFLIQNLTFLRYVSA